MPPNDTMLSGPPPCALAVAGTAIIIDTPMMAAIACLTFLPPIWPLGNEYNGRSHGHQ